MNAHTGSLGQRVSSEILLSLFSDVAVVNITVAALQTTFSYIYNINYNSALNPEKECEQ